MTNVAVIEGRAEAAAPAVPVSETAAVYQMIERAARDPSVDLDKIERLMRMRKEMRAEEAELAFNAAMRAAQAEMRPISANATNPQTKSRYATYDKLDRELRPIYTKHGFSVSWDEADSPKQDHIRVLAYVSHDAGHTRTYHKDMPADGKGAKGGDVMTKTHAVGAASSYGARYLLKGIFNVAIGEDDRDGNAPGTPISPEQLGTLRILIDEASLDIERFCSFFKVAALIDVTVEQLPAITARLQARKAKIAKSGEAQS